MSNEERLKQIRERRADAVRIAAKSAWLNSASWTDIDFLLSLLDNQAAELDLLRRASANPENGNYGATVYNGEGNYALLAQNAIDRNVTEMRNKCVESVGSICDEYKADLFSTDDEAYKASLGFAVDALDRAIAKISSLTLDQVEQCLEP